MPRALKVNVLCVFVVIYFICNAFSTPLVNYKNPSMLRLTGLLITLAFIISSCSKNNDDADILHGTWVKGSNFGDTLIFSRENGAYVLKYNMSFNPTLPAYHTSSYTYQDNKLKVDLYGSLIKTEISSFTWKQHGKEFEVLGYQLFPIMSSTGTKFTYTKIN